MTKYNFICIISVFIFSSCNREAASDLAEAGASTGFAFAGIEYTVNEASYTKDAVKRQEPVTIINNSGAEQAYIFYPQKNIAERSTFWSGDTRAFSFVDGRQKVKVPVTMSGKGAFTYDDGTRWSYSAGEQMLEPATDSRQVIRIKPYHQLTVTPAFHLKEFATGYRLHLKGIEFGEELVIDGLWSGVFFVDYEIDYRVEPIR